MLWHLYNSIMKQHSHGLDRGAAVAFRISRFSSAYRQRLLDGIEDVQKFCSKERECSLASVASRPRLADKLLCDYVMGRFETGSKGTLSLVKHALLGCQHVFPRLKGKIDVGKNSASHDSGHLCL